MREIKTKKTMEAEMSLEKAIEVLEGQTKIWDHSLAYITTMTVQCAIELKIPDVIYSHGHPITLSDLVTALQISPSKSSFLSRLMRILVHLGYFIFHEEHYGVGPLCEFLVNDNPFNSRSLILFANDPIIVKPWRHMSSWFLTKDDDDESKSKSPFCVAHGGKSLYEVISADPEFGRNFIGGLDRDGSLFGKAFVVKCRASFEGFNSLVDVGGNTGIVAMAIAEAFPDMECTVFELPNIVDQAAGGGGSTRGNLKFVGGDMFQGIPSADIILLKRVLSDWGDESCLKLLKEAKKAATKKLMIVDYVLGHSSWSDQASTGTILRSDMIAMAVSGGIVRSEQQWAKLFSDAGFSNYTVTPVHGFRALIQVYP